MRRLAVLMLLALATPAWPASKPSWKDFADCAAAYRVNAAIKDPSRTATMSGDMALTGFDYRHSAVALRKRQTGDADAAVDARINAQASRFKAMSRERLDKFIDACPQMAE
jgi:hypothetical protein